jgi:putative sterol carrier protein
LIGADLRQRLTLSTIRLLGRLAPRSSPGIAVMMLYLAFLPEASEGVDVVYELDLRGPGGGVFTVEVDDGRCRIHTGRIERAPDVVYEMDAATWLAMTQGLATGDEAVLLGKLRIKGAPDLGRKFNDFFAPVGDPPIRAASMTVSERGNDVTRPSFVDRVLRRNPAA